MTVSFTLQTRLRVEFDVGASVFVLGTVDADARFGAGVRVLRANSCFAFLYALLRHLVGRLYGVLVVRLPSHNVKALVYSDGGGRDPSLSFVCQ